jgi:hypothetical protein
MSQQLFVVRSADRPGISIAETSTLDIALEVAADRAAQAPGTVFEVLEPATGTVSLRVRAGDAKTVLVQEPNSRSSGDAWPDPPAWRRLAMQP